MHPDESDCSLDEDGGGAGNVGRDADEIQEEKGQSLVIRYGM